MIDPEIVSFYERGLEDSRLEKGPGRLELVRTQELVSRRLPPPPAEVLDVGGGSGVYSRWLAGLGYRVRLVDPVPLHVRQARERGGLIGVERGDARKLARPDASADALLLMGPLYHLVARADRLKCLRESRRVLRPGGVVFAAAVSRFAPVFSGLQKKAFEDPAARALLDGVLSDGRHLNPTRKPAYFTTAFFHRPEELRAEIAEAGLELESLLAVEGPGWLIPDLDFYWARRDRRERLLAILRAVEAEPALLASSSHILAVARRPRARRSRSLTSAKRK
jgi:ubiquinone/menaquinone biosynthesis C-methylase UbiE